MSNYTTWIENSDIDESEIKEQDKEKQDKSEKQDKETNEQIAPHVMQHTISSHQKTNEQEQIKRNTFSRLGGLTGMKDNNTFQRLELFSEEKQLH
jgi:hypothetical protein